ncbi:UNC-like C-terminal-domain-containing protein, partial [Tribonema minus]
MVPDKEEGDSAKLKPTKLKNYASKDSGAVMMEHSPGTKGADNLLVDSKDKYTISPCEEKQWVVIGLSEDILVRTIKLGSYEKYSRIVKEFQVLASQSFPVDNWMDLGVFTAADAHGEQTFELPSPAFARYLKFKLLSHYGDDYYCTLSHVRVHGSTMLESFHEDWQAS